MADMELYVVSVEKLEPVKWDVDAMDRLVLDSKKKAMLKGLVGQQNSNRNLGMRGDLITGKGQSLIVLLHGPPGVSLCFASPVSVWVLTISSRSEKRSLPSVSLRLYESRSYH